MTWIPLREFLAASVDEQIAAEPDREARAVLTYNRDRIVDQLELAVLRNALAERDAEHGPTQIVRLNGHKHRVAKVQ